MKRQWLLRLSLVVVGSASFAMVMPLRAEEPSQQSPPNVSPTSPAPVVRPKPKPLSESATKGLEWLARQQRENGGWGQGGGWRMAAQGGERVEGPKVQDPPDIGNTCIAALAFIRAGNTPAQGPYATNVAQAVEFITKTIEKSDSTSLYVSDIRDTQLQQKIGPYVDTFLTAMVLAELKGKMPNAKSEKELLASLDKTIHKIEKNQKEDGTFAKNEGWASVLSQGLCNKGLNRARQAGANVSDLALSRVERQVKGNFEARGGAVSSFRGMGGGFGGGSGGGLGGGGGSSGPSDAGVELYRASSKLANLQDAVNTNQAAQMSAKKVLQDATSSKEDKGKAEKDLTEIEDTKKVAQEAQSAVADKLNNRRFVAGFGSNGGEEFLSFMNISETLLVKGGDKWEKWDKQVSDGITKAQDKDGSWSGQHCITGKTFCTGAALLVLMADREPIPVAVADTKEVKKDQR